MRTIGLTAYGICVKTKEDNRKIEMHSIDNTEFIEIVKNAIDDEKSKYKTDENNESVFCYDDSEKEIIYDEDGREVFTILYVRVKTGEYGIETEIVDTTTGRVSHNRTPQEADVMPFGFAICIPAGEVDNGILILQSSGRNGIKLVLNKQINKIIKQINGDYRFEMNIVVPRVVLNRFFEQGTLKAIHFVRYEIPDEDAERLGINHSTETQMDVTIRKPLGFLQNKATELSEWRRGERAFSDIVQIEGFEYNELKMDFKLGKTSKTVNLANVDNLQMIEDITDKVHLEGGHPTFDSLKEQMKQTGKEYLLAKGLIIE